MVEWLQRTVASLMNQVRVNRIEKFERDGVETIVKRRQAGGSIAVFFANIFLALAGSGSRMFVRGKAWIDWELYCTDLLYFDRQASAAKSATAIQFRKVPGVSLRDMALRNRLHVDVIVAVARELRRVHGAYCKSFESGWSHGDVHLDNKLFSRSLNDREFKIVVGSAGSWVERATSHSRGANFIAAECMPRRVCQRYSSATRTFRSFDSTSIARGSPKRSRRYPSWRRYA